MANTTNISFDRIEAESLLIALDLEGIAVSTGSACSSGTLEPSHVLKAMGLPPHRTQNSIRFSLGAANTDDDVERVVAVLPGHRREATQSDPHPGASIGNEDKNQAQSTEPRAQSLEPNLRIVVAMSGGVDSSVAAALLAEQGHDVIGLSMQLYDQSGTQSFGSCCTLDDLHDARRVASAQGFPHYIVNFERQFSDTVISNFVGGVHVRPHADSVRALQQRPEVLDTAGPRARTRRRVPRHGTLRTGRAGA